MLTQRSRSSETIIKLSVGIIILALGFFANTAFGQRNRQAVVWNPENITKTIGNGDIASPSTVKFRVTEPLTDIDLFVVPELEKYMTVEPSHFSVLAPNTDYELSISYSLPPQALEGTFNGTIHLRKGKATIAKPLKASVVVDFAGNMPSPDVITLSRESQQLISGVASDGNGIFFSNINPEILQIIAGKILALPPGPYLPAGFLGRVTSVSTYAGYFISTQPVSLSEAFTNASVNLDRVLTEEDLSTSMALTPGVSLQSSKSVPNTRKTLLGTGLTAQLEDVVVYDADGNPTTTSDQVLIDGSVTINPQIHISFDLDDFHLTQMAFTVGLGESANLTVKSRLQATFLEGEKEFAHYRWNPIIVWVGWVPVVLVPETSLVARAEGSASIGVQVEFNQASNMTAGVGFANGSWHPISEFSFSATAGDPTFSAGIDLKGKVGPRFKLLLYGVIGPRVDIAGFAELDIDIFRTPIWQVFGGLEVSAGVRLQIFDHTIADQSFPLLIQYRILIAEGGVAANGLIIGSVRDAVTRQPLPNSVVSVFRDGDLISTLLTNSGGQFEVPALAGAVYRFQISRSGYLPVSYENVTVRPNETRTLDVILQIDENNGGPGIVSGFVFNAISGAGVSGLTVDLRPGLNNTTGTVLRTTTTGTGGAYSFTNLPAGNYTAEASGTGYSNSNFPILCIGNTTTANQNGVISPTLPENQIRIVLTWGATPADLDSHFFGPLPDGTRFHMYYPLAGTRSPWPTIVQLDLDDVTSFGPETTTLFQQINGIYKFSVHDYTNRNSTTSGALSASQAQVRIYRGNNLTASFNVPLGQPGTLWTVFELEGNEIRPINQMSFSTAPTSLQSQTPADSEFFSDSLPEKN